jgi:hypothetical protein
MVNWKGFRRKCSSLRQYAEICMEKPETNKLTNEPVNDLFFAAWTMHFKIMKKEKPTKWLIF